MGESTSTHELSSDMRVSQFDHRINKTDLIICGAFLAFVLIIGTILLLVGLNEALFIENATVRAVFKVITDIGSENINIAIFCTIYLAIDKKFGRRMIIFFGITNYFTGFLKWTFQDPRPPANAIYEYGEPSYGFPSGHTTNAVSVWGYSYLASQDMEKSKRIPLQTIFIVLFLLIPYSRLVLGVHDVNDIMGGYALGIISTIILMYIEPKFEEKLQSWNLTARILTGVLISILIWIGGASILGALHPEDKLEQIQDLALVGGLLMGVAIGFPLEEKYVNYHPEYLPWRQKLIAGVIGLILTFGSYFALSALFGLFPDEIYAYTRFIRYGLLVTIVGVLIPMLLKKIFKQ